MTKEKLKFAIKTIRELEPATKIRLVLALISIPLSVEMIISLIVRWK